MPFSPTPARALADRLAQSLTRTGKTVAVSALPIDLDPTLVGQQCAWIRLLRAELLADVLVCLGETAGLLAHPDKRVWLANEFTDFNLGSSPQVSYSKALGEARLVACTGDHPWASKPGVVRLPLPVTDDDWDQTSRTIAA